jgi:hypothetical protein
MEEPPGHHVLAVLPFSIFFAVFYNYTVYETVKMVQWCCLWQGKALEAQREPCGMDIR